MSWWNNLISGGSEQEKPDYYQEGTELLRAEKFHEALTSFRLVLRETPNDTAALQQVAVAYTKIGMTDEAVRTYRKVLENEPHEPAAHYGLAFLLLQRGEEDEAVAHLRAFLARPPEVEEAKAHIDHARITLTELTGEEVT